MEALGLIRAARINGLSEAVAGLLRPEAIAPRCAEPQPRVRQKQETFEEQLSTLLRRHRCELRTLPNRGHGLSRHCGAADLLLQGGGFSAIVLDMGSLAPEFVSRVPLATWFRYRAAAERTQSSILLLTQHACAKSSAELLLRLQPAEAICDEATVFTGIQPHVEVARQRFTQTQSNVIPLRKPPQNVSECCDLAEPNGMGRCAMTKPAELYACLYAKEFPAQALLRLRPELHSKPCVVMEGEAAITTCLFSEHKGAAARHGSRHDASGGRYFP